MTTSSPPVTNGAATPAAAAPEQPPAADRLQRHFTADDRMSSYVDDINCCCFTPIIQAVVNFFSSCFGCLTGCFFDVIRWFRNPRLFMDERPFRNYMAAAEGANPQRADVMAAFRQLPATVQTQIRTTLRETYGAELARRTQAVLQAERKGPPIRPEEAAEVALQDYLAEFPTDRVIRRLVDIG